MILLPYLLPHSSFPSLDVQIWNRCRRWNLSKVLVSKSPLHYLFSDRNGSVSQWKLRSTAAWIFQDMEGSVLVSTNMNIVFPHLTLSDLWGSTQSFLKIEEAFTCPMGSVLPHLSQHKSIFHNQPLCCNTVGFHNNRQTIIA